MEQERDVYDYDLALRLGCSLADIRAMPSSDYVEWRAYFVYKNAMREMNNE